MTVDIITEFAFGSCANLLNEHPSSFDSEFLKALDFATEVPYKMYYSLTQRLAAKWTPLSIAARFEPALQQMANVIQMAANSHDAYTRRTSNSSHPVVFDNLQSVPDDLQKTESIDILIAGSDTTAFTLTTALYHISRMPEVEKKLVESLNEAFSQSETGPSLLQLEQIKYLVRTISIAFVGNKNTFMLTQIQRACVNEALRVAMPVPGVLPRVVPKQSQPFVVDGKVVPPGVSHRAVVLLYLGIPVLTLTDTDWNVGVHDA